MWFLEALREFWGRLNIFNRHKGISVQIFNKTFQEKIKSALDLLSQYLPDEWRLVSKRIKVIYSMPTHFRREDFERFVFHRSKGIIYVDTTKNFVPEDLAAFLVMSAFWLEHRLGENITQNDLFNRALAARVSALEALTKDVSSVEKLKREIKDGLYQKMFEKYPHIDKRMPRYEAA